MLNQAMDITQNSNFVNQIHFYVFGNGMKNYRVERVLI